MCPKCGFFAACPKAPCSLLPHNQGHREPRHHCICAENVRRMENNCFLKELRPDPLIKTGPSQPQGQLRKELQSRWPVKAPSLCLVRRMGWEPCSQTELGLGTDSPTFYPFDLSWRSRFSETVFLSIKGGHESYLMDCSENEMSDCHPWPGVPSPSQNRFLIDTVI